MTYMKIRVGEDDDFTGVIEIEKYDEEKEPIERKFATGVILSHLLALHPNKKLNLRDLEIILDFDDEGSLISVEFYT